MLLAARTMRHYFNNRLALTVGYMELIADDPATPPHVRELALKAMEGARSAGAILKALQTVRHIQHHPRWVGPPILYLPPPDPRDESAAPHAE